MYLLIISYNYLQAATTPQHSLIFQCEYAQLRSEVLQAHLQLQLACSCVKTSPPPAIAASVATATRDELQKCGRVVLQVINVFHSQIKLKLSGELIYCKKHPY